MRVQWRYELLPEEIRHLGAWVLDVTAYLLRGPAR
jgi:hypothetical protein